MTDNSFAKREEQRLKDEEEQKRRDAEERAFGPEYKFIVATRRHHAAPDPSAKSVYQANAMVFRDESPVASTSTHKSNTKKAIAAWIANNCEDGVDKNFHLKKLDAEMHAITELENMGDLRGLTVVMYGADGPCSSCKENLKEFAKKNEVKLICAYTKPFKKEYDFPPGSGKKFSDGWEDAESAGEYSYKIFDRRP